MARVAPRSLLLVDPEENVIIGSQNIMRYMKWKSIVTLYDWVELYGFPAIKTPSGKWMTSMTAIDQWIMLAAEADRENRPHSRGTNARADIKRRQVEERFDEDSIQVHYARLREYVGKDGPKPNWSKSKRARNAKNVSELEMEITEARREDAQDN